MISSSRQYTHCQIGISSDQQVKWTMEAMSSTDSFVKRNVGILMDQFHS